MGSADLGATRNRVRVYKSRGLCHPHPGPTVHIRNNGFCAREHTRLTYGHFLWTPRVLHHPQGQQHSLPSSYQGAPSAGACHVCGFSMHMQYHGLAHPLPQAFAWPTLRMHTLLHQHLEDNTTSPEASSYLGSPCSRLGLGVWVLSLGLAATLVHSQQHLPLKNCNASDVRTRRQNPTLEGWVDVGMTIKSNRNEPLFTSTRPAQAIFTRTHFLTYETP